MTAPSLRPGTTSALLAWGFAPERSELLAGDASTRAYLRVRDGARTAVVMDCGAALPHRGDPEPVAFLRWQRFYAELGLRVPDVLEIDRAAGLLLLEDLGDEMLQHRVEARGPEACEREYEQAAAIALRVREEGTARFDESAWPQEDPLVPARLALEMDLFLVHAARVELPQDLADLPPLRAAAAALDRDPPDAVYDARTLLHVLCEDVAGFAEPMLCHRDFHARNLMPVGRELAVIDFQDTRRGPRAYDLASLAWDPYVTLPKSMVERLVAWLRPEGVGDSEWDEEVRLCAGQRLIKAAGSYAWLSRACGREQYAQWLAPALARAHERLACWPRRDDLWRHLRAAGAIE